MRQSIATALLAEATASLDLYMKLFGKHLEQTPEGGLPAQRATFREYQLFPIFENLSSALGIFPKQEAGQIARSYTEGGAGGFVDTLRMFLAGMDRLDELNRKRRRAKLRDDRIAEAILTEEYNTLRADQLDFWVEVKGQHRRVTGQLYEDLKSVLEPYSK